MPPPKLLLIITLLSICGTVSTAIAHFTPQAMCTKLGITPEHATVLGMDATQTQAAFSRLDEQGSTIQSLQSQDIQRQSLMSELKEAKRNIRLLETHTDVQDAEQHIQQLQTQITSLESSIKALQSNLRAIFFANPDSALIERVCVPTGLAGLLPAEYRVMELRDEDYSDIYGALLAEQRAADDGVLPDTDTQLLLSGFRNLPEIQQARSNLLYNLDAVRGVFDD